MLANIDTMLANIDIILANIDTMLANIDAMLANTALLAVITECSWYEHHPATQLNDDVLNIITP